MLEPLDTIECRDAVMNADGSEAAWPVADAVVGNPPFVGDKKMRGELGDAYTEQLRAAYKGRVPGGADFVCYWFEKARAQIEAGRLQRAGLVASNVLPIGTANKALLKLTVASAPIFEAWRDLQWVNNGAAVRVSLTAFGIARNEVRRLNDEVVEAISPELESVSSAALVAGFSPPQSLMQNKGAALQGITKGGGFDVTGEVARRWAQLPNPNGRSNADCVKPWWNGEAVTQRNPDKWIIDFFDMDCEQAALYEAPFTHVLTYVKPERDTNSEPATRRNFWLFKRSGAEMRKQTSGLRRVIATPETPTHTVFVWMPSSVVADKNLVVIARSDDSTMGLLASRFHLAWVRRFGAPYGSHATARRYTSSRTFDPFPFPSSLTPADTASQTTEALADSGALIPADLPAAIRPHAEAIARAAKQLTDLRERWLNPPEWTDRVPEVVPLGMTASPYPDRIVAKPGHEAALAKRTLTQLYNQRPAWLAQAHAALDRAVAAAYGWPETNPTDPAVLSDDEVLRRLLALNLSRAAAGP